MLREKLLQIKRGMTVLDRNREPMGEVVNIFYSDENPDSPGPDTVTAPDQEPSNAPNWVDEFVESFSIDREIPETVKNRLHREGFIRVHKDFYLGDRDYFIPISQIMNVLDDTVILNVTAKQAIDLG